MSLNSPALAVALLASFSALPQASTPSTTTPAHAALPREKGVLYGVVGRNESIPNGSLLRVDLAKLAIEDLGPVAAHDGLHFPTDAALDPDGKHLWIAQTSFGGTPEAWRTVLQRIELATRKEDRWIPVSGTTYLDALAFDAAGHLLAIERSSVPENLVRVDRTNGTFTRLGDTGDFGVRGLAFHGAELWAVAEKRVPAPQHVEELLRLDPANGHVLAHTPIPVGTDEHALALAFTPSGRCLLSLQGPSSPPGRIASIDPTTGALTTWIQNLLVPHGMQAAK